MENTKVMEENTMQQTDEIEIDLWEICLVLVHNCIGGNYDCAGYLSDNTAVYHPQI